MTRRPRIALVESDDLILLLLRRWLAQAGFGVQPVAASALAGRRFDLVIADVPGADGAAPLVATLNAATAAPLLLISARFPSTAAGSAALAERLGVRAVLPKPFTRGALLAAVQQALAAG